MPRQIGPMNTTSTPRKRRRRRTVQTGQVGVGTHIPGQRSGAATGVSAGTVGGSSAMQKTAGHDLANIVFGYSLGRGIAPKQALEFLNGVAVNW